MTSLNELLKRKIDLDQLGENENQFTQRFRWLLEAVEFLLRAEQERARK
jgi:hypothetical protein